MIVPNIDDALVSALIYQENGEVEARTVIFSRPHPNRADSLMMVQQRVEDGVLVTEYQVLADDISDQLRLIPTTLGSFLGEYVFYTFPPRQPVTTLLEASKDDVSLRDVLQRCLGLTGDALYETMKWKG